jgi:uncharacterized NAD-dependent epimerase/dehydratase family protein
MDHVVSDFTPGAVEALITAHHADADLLFVEGQGGMNHTSHAPVTLALRYGAAPDALLLVHNVTRAKIQDVRH